MTTLLVRDKATGRDVEVLAFAGDDYVFVAPPGHPEAGELVPRERLDPDPRIESLRRGFTPWTSRLGAAAEA